MSGVLDALRELGVAVDDDGRGTLPFTVAGRGRVRGGAVTIDASASSQFVSALLLAGAAYNDGVVVRHDGPPVPSLPHIEMTMACLREHGVEVRVDGDTWTVPHTRHPGRRRHHRARPVQRRAVPDARPDQRRPGAGPGLATRRPPRRATRCADLLDPHGGRRAPRRRRPDRHRRRDHRSASTPTCTTSASSRRPWPPCAPLASTPSRLRGIAHIRGHETDRLAALSTELERPRAPRSPSTTTGCPSSRPPLHGGTFHTYADHRMAHAAVVVGSAVEGVLVEDVATTSKTFPGFDRGLGRAARVTRRRTAHDDRALRRARPGEL